jgi:predicted nucleotidyltransferase
MARMTDDERNASLSLDATKELIVQDVLAYYPMVQGIYLFGSHGTADERPDSDVDIALLLPPDEAKRAGHLALSDLHLQLSTTLGRNVDLLNARLVSTVFQKAIIFGELIYCADRYAVDEFEMLTLSYYQKLNEERAEIVAEFRRTGRAYPV